MGWPRVARHNGAGGADMRFKKLDLNLLVALDHMIETRSVSVAAERMFMSQSAMSNALTRLRQYFDDPLLVQVGRRMEITPHAEAMRPAIRDILVRIEATIDAKPEFDPQTTDRTFNLLLSDYSLRVLMPQVFRMLAAQQSTARFKLHAQSNNPQVLLERGDIDLLLLPRQFLSDDHPSTQLFQDELCIIACAKGRFGQSPPTPESFESAEHVIMVPASGARTFESLVLQAAGVTRQVAVETFSFATLPYLLPGTDRIAMIHRRLAQLIAPDAALVIHPLPFAQQPFCQMLQSHAYRDSDPGIAWLKSVMLEAAAALEMH